MKKRVLVIGGGIAGLFAALRASTHFDVTLATKSTLSDSNTRYAQGGIAAVMFPDDSIESHIADTLAAGDGLCNEEAVRILCTEGPERVRDLSRIGVAFDKEGNTLARGREAAHSAFRVLHAGGDATGYAIQVALEAAVRGAGTKIHEHFFLTRLLSDGSVITGAEFLTPDAELVNIQADAVILATGGAGQVYKYTTNPEVATGDGVACAYRAGARIADAQMYQFHPTMFAGPGQFLISEAVRGEGAVLLNARGERFMPERHRLAELAPRDVVARAIAEEMAKAGGEPVLLDATAMDAEFLHHRFPNIDRHLQEAGFDWSQTPIPVSPAAHFWMGGIATDVSGKTSLPGLFAIGEAACTGVHGANRLASNSLLEGIVFAQRAVEAITNGEIGEHRNQITNNAPATPQQPGIRSEIQQLAWNNIGLVREEHGLRVAQKQINAWTTTGSTPHSRMEFENANLLCIAQLIASAALDHKESRGAHYRSDFPRA